jgi:hypothetical protein
MKSGLKEKSGEVSRGQISQGIPPRGSKLMIEADRSIWASLIGARAGGERQFFSIAVVGTVLGVCALSTRRRHSPFARIG